MRLRASLLALGLLAPASIVLPPDAPSRGPTTAEAAVSMALSLDELVSSSSYVVIAKAAEKQSVWEDLPGGRRIVTYTRLDVERAVAGEPGTSVWVRTLGGVVGEIGQWVSGEASIAPGSRALFFLYKAGPSVVVTGMAQGHFPVIVEDGGVTKIGGSPDPGTVLPRRGPTLSARETIGGVTLERAVATIQEVRRAQRERK